MYKKKKIYIFITFCQIKTKITIFIIIYIPSVYKIYFKCIKSTKVLLNTDL